MSRVETTTNFRDSNGVDLGKKLVTKDYLISVYPEIGDKIGIPPELWIWGSESSGSLGNGRTASNISTPITTFAGGTNWKQVFSFSSNAWAIKTDGTLWCWGGTNNGALGNGVTTGSGGISTPVTTFAGGTNWKQVDISSAIKTDGTLWTWGYGLQGNLGNAQITNRSTPVTTFAGGTNWKQLSSSSFRRAAIKTDGTLWIWGRAAYGALGNGVTTGTISTPITTFAGGTNWKQVSSGSSHIAAIKTDGTLWVWGIGTFGRLGNGVTTGTISTPITTFAGGTNWKQVSAGNAHTAAIKTDGTLWTWGNNASGALGDGTTAGSLSTPITTFAGGTNWKQVNAGVTQTAAIKTDGTLWIWGGGGNGRLGNAQTTDVSTPVTTFVGGTNWKQVSTRGNSQVAAIQSVDFSPF
jgi:alpha-tubulin suppressor-like RCC1 family protein